MVGTPRRTVVPVRRITSSAASASKRPISATHAPADDGRAHDPGLAEDVGERRRSPRTTSSGVSSSRGPATNVRLRAQSLVRELGALRLTGRPGRVEDHGGVGAVAIDDLRHRLGGRRRSRIEPDGVRRPGQRLRLPAR